MGLALQKSGLTIAPREAVATVTPARRKTLRERFAKGEVEWSPDFERIMNLPRRTKPELEAITRGLTQLLRKPGGTQELRDLQGWCLYEGPAANGLVATIQTGGGKTLIGMLMPMVWPYIKQADGTMRPPRCVLLIPADLRVQFQSDWKRYGEHWNLPTLAGEPNFQQGKPILHVISYSDLQQPKNSALLEQLQPDLLMGDEISCLRNFESARTIRATRFFARFYNTAFCGWDATITEDSLEDFWHLLAWALGENSPMPVEPAEVRRWARAIDPDRYNDGFYLPGVLMKFCKPGEKESDVRRGFHRRLVDTFGVVTSADKRLGIPLVFRQRIPPPMPAAIAEYLKTLRRPPNQGGWCRPDGEQLEEASQVVACARQLGTGFFLRWKYPRGEPAELIEEWFSKRQDFNRELRSELGSPRVHMDSRKLCENAAERWYTGGCPDCQRGPLEFHRDRQWANGSMHRCPGEPTHPLWASECWPAWRAIKDKVYHETEAVWVSDWLMQDAAAWAREAPGIVWVEHPEEGEFLSKLTGFRYYGGGEKSAAELDELYGEGTGRAQTSIICSVKANIRGKNLQYAFSRNLIVSWMASNSTMEQLIGRTYREGQTEPQVTVDYYLHTKEFENSMETSLERAKYHHETLGQAQKLVYGTWERKAA